MLTALGCLAAKTIGTDGTNRGYQRMHEHEWAFHHVNKLALMPKIGAVFGQEEDLQMIFARELAAAAVTSISGRYSSIFYTVCISQRISPASPVLTGPHFDRR